MRKVERQLRERLKAAQAEIEIIKADRQRYRDYFTTKYKWFLELHGNGSTANTAFMVLDLAQFFSRVGPFYW